MKRSLLIVLLTVIGVGAVITSCPAIDHGPYGSLLEEHVRGGYFDYESLRDNAKDQQLKDYRHRMARVDTDELDDTEALAYWINLYNASTLHLIDKHYPVDSIKDIGGWFSSPFGLNFIPTQQGKISLDTIEHDIIRPSFDEPRIHFALVCAAKSCPPLRFEAYVAQELDDQLEDQAQWFLESNTNRFLVKNGELQMKLSSIFYWYGEDFGGEPGIANFVKDYLPRTKAKLIESNNYTISYLDYDWSLNQAPGPYDR